MAYEMVMPYHLHMPSYFLETFTEYPYRIDGDNYSGMGMYIPNSFTTPKYLLWNNYFKSSIAWYHASGWAETESIWGN